MADDDADDRRLTQEAFEEGRLINVVRYVEHGEELMDYLRKQGKYAPPAEAPRPGLILLDLNMPRMNGIELVRKIRGEARLQNLPVVIVSYKDRAEDRLQGLEAGANHYLAKGGFRDTALLEVVMDLIGPAREEPAR